MVPCHLHWYKGESILSPSSQTGEKGLVPGRKGIRLTFRNLSGITVSMVAATHVVVDSSMSVSWAEFICSV